MPARKETVVRVVVLALCITGLVSSAHADAVVFSTDFHSSVPSEIAPGIALLNGVQGYAGLGPTGNQFSGNFLRSETANVVTVSLTGLPPHTAISLGFRFAAIDSLDSNGTVDIGPDTDGDSIPDSADNCRLVSNASQCDSDNDGFGNRCDGDLNDNAATNAQDYVLFRQQLGQPSVAPTYNEADINCNGAVNAQDYVLFRGLLGSAPGPGAGL